MSWTVLAFVSAMLLGCYDIAKKASVKDNAVPAVLLVNVLTAGLLWLGPIGYSLVISQSGDTPASPHAFQQLIQVSPREHGLLLIKSVLVGCSWMCAFFALKHLPLSIAAPIRATSPLWTIVMAVAVMGERPAPLQWLGIAIVVIAFFAFSRVGVREGIHFHRDRWVSLMMFATLLGAISSLYDKYLLQQLAIPPTTVQAWFSVYLVPVMLPLAIRWYVRERKTVPFEWRPTIPLIAITLLAADYAYFVAVADPDALLSVISPVRRSAVVIPFLFGVVYCKEQNWHLKAACIIANLAGVFFLSQTA
jgi:transporter family protein